MRGRGAAAAALRPSKFALASRGPRRLSTKAVPAKARTRCVVVIVDKGVAVVSAVLFGFAAAKLNTVATADTTVDVFVRAAR